jgi:hypothetical protein
MKVIIIQRTGLEHSQPVARVRPWFGGWLIAIRRS